MAQRSSPADLARRVQARANSLSAPSKSLPGVVVVHGSPDEAGAAAPIGASGASLHNIERQCTEREEQDSIAAGRLARVRIWVDPHETGHHNDHRGAQ